MSLSYGRFRKVRYHMTHYINNPTDSVGSDYIVFIRENTIHPVVRIIGAHNV